MNGKNQILICKVCDYYLGFEVGFIHQIIQIRHVKDNLKEGMIEFRDENIPIVNIFHSFSCNDSSLKFIIILDSKKGLFATFVSEIVGIIPVEPHIGSDVANGLKSFVIEDCAKRFIIFNELPVAVVDTEKVMRSVTGKRRMGESDK
ncbi:chemotaxis protein CheW [candidate division WOR-3 bacterium]|nr:chemotaxis protein CheW [candidate division WOR-3 bacterium]